jgi:cobalt-precorrin 5A hydrolase / precorrin-3B C17-methyltransferase
MKSIAAITTTPAGLSTLAPLCTALKADIWISPTLATAADSLKVSHQIYSHSLQQFLADHWQTYDGWVFCLATGAVVRLIAPLLQDKATDPAVVVIDEAGQFAISLCGAHQGGADHLAQQVSQILGTQSILTGAANHLQMLGIDILGTPFGWVKGSGDWTGVSAAIANRSPVQIIQDCGSTLWQQHLPSNHPFSFGFPEFNERQQQPQPQARVWISTQKRSFAEASNFPKVQWHPRVLWVGIGCERGTPQALIEHAISQVFTTRHLALEAIAGIATLELKADEPGLVAFCQAHYWPLHCFTAQTLKAIPVPNPSATVEAAVGTPSVAEAAAIRAATHPPSLDSPLTSPDSPLILPKQIIHHPDYPGAVTVAIAQAQQEFTGRQGELYLVGTGPGDLAQITPAAKAAINRADAVIGYSLYIDLIRPLLRPGQIVESWPITQEVQRAERAIELANWGLSVAVISSGDCGIYGMAGLVLETLQAHNWDGQTPAVQVFPGISALQSAASRVGAPLMHDFCAISLSNLLTPWPVIQTRIQAAAQADFVVALYNPKSQTRTTQIEYVQTSFLDHRPPETPVALARSLYRDDEQIVLTTLADMLNHPIDMLTTVIIGNQSSRLHAGWFITPRGYLQIQTK